MSASALAEIEAAVERAGDADDALRGVVETLVRHGGCSFAAILFSEDGGLATGPQAGEPDRGRRVQLPVVYEGARVAELVADGCDDTALLDRVAALIAAHCLVGWDTAGEPWTP